MVLGFDQSFVIKHTLKLFIVRAVAHQIYTDSQSLFESLISLNSTTENRLLIDLNILRECYERKEVSGVF